MRRPVFRLGSLPLFLALLASPAGAKESLGVYSDWAAFRDEGEARCYAIAMPRPSRLERAYEPYASIGTWPGRNIRGQVHFRLSRELARQSRITLTVGRQRFALAGGGNDAWASDPRADAAIVATMRFSGSMTIRATDSRGRRFSDTYPLAGAATAMDAATVACSRGG